MISSDYLLLLNALFFSAPQRIHGLIKKHPTIDSFKENLHQEEMDEFKWSIYKSFNSDQVKEKLSNLGIGYLTFESPQYPNILNQIHNPPPLLFYKGDLTLCHSTQLAVVGPRKPTDYGAEVTRELTKTLCERFTITSGLALGVDAIAHQTALDQSCPTIAVIGCGLDIPYPQENMSLRKQIEEQGLVFSEYPLGTEPIAYHFPQRNRIVSGLSSGVLVVEAQEKSGALITAQFAMEQNREVFAVPGSIFSESTIGVHRLIQDGAKLVMGPNDIFQELTHTIKLPFSHPIARKNPSTPRVELTKANPEKPFSLSPKEEQVFDLLTKTPHTVDDLSDKTNLDIQELLQILSFFELQEIAEENAQNQYTLCGLKNN